MEKTVESIEENIELNHKRFIAIKMIEGDVSYEHYVTEPILEKIQNLCFYRAHLMIENNLSQGMSLFELTDLLISVEREKNNKQQTDQKSDIKNGLITTFQTISKGIFPKTK